MRSMTVVFVALIGLALPAVASAQETGLKIGYIYSEEIIKAAPGYTEANDAFNRTATAWRPRSYAAPSSRSPRSARYAENARAYDAVRSGAPFEPPSITCGSHTCGHGRPMPVVVVNGLIEPIGRERHHAN